MTILTYKTRDEAPEDLRDAITEKDGVFTVAVVPKSKVDEFRENNISLSKFKEAAEPALAAVAKLYTDDTKDLDALAKEVAELRATSQKVKDGSLKTNDAIDTEVNKRVANMQRQHADATAEVANQNKVLVEKLGIAESKLRDNILITAARDVIRDEKIGLNPSAEKAIIAEFREVFKVREDGTITATDAAGNTIWAANGKDVITLREYADTELRKKAEYVFKPSKGSNFGNEFTREGVPNAAERAKLSEDELWALVAKGK